MISIGKYMAAAKGGPNVGSKATKIHNPVDMTPLQSHRSGSMAGYEGGKSAWIQMDGSGYSKRTKPPLPSGADAKPFRAKTSPVSSGSNYRKPDYSRVTKDQDLSRLI